MSFLFSEKDFIVCFGIEGVYGGVELKGVCLYFLKLVSEYVRVVKEFGVMFFYDLLVICIEKYKIGYVVVILSGLVLVKYIFIVINVYIFKCFYDSVDNK